MQKLSELKAGTLGRICAIGGNAHFQSRIASVGLTPGCTVEICTEQEKATHAALCQEYTSGCEPTGL